MAAAMLLAHPDRVAKNNVVFRFMCDRLTPSLSDMVGQRFEGATDTDYKPYERARVTVSNGSTCLYEQFDTYFRVSARGKVLVQMVANQLTFLNFTTRGTLLFAHGTGMVEELLLQHPNPSQYMTVAEKYSVQDVVCADARGDNLWACSADCMTVYSKTGKIIMPIRLINGIFCAVLALDKDSAIVLVRNPETHVLGLQQYTVHESGDIRESPVPEDVMKFNKLQTVFTPAASNIRRGAGAAAFWVTHGTREAILVLSNATPTVFCALVDMEFCSPADLPLCQALITQVCVIQDDICLAYIVNGSRLGMVRVSMVRRNEISALPTFTVQQEMVSDLQLLTCIAPPMVLATELVSMHLVQGVLDTKNNQLNVVAKVARHSVKAENGSTYSKISTASTATATVAKLTKQVQEAQADVVAKAKQVLTLHQQLQSSEEARKTAVEKLKASTDTNKRLQKQVNGGRPTAASGADGVQDNLISVCHEYGLEGDQLDQFVKVTGTMILDHYHTANQTITQAHKDVEKAQQQTEKAQQDAQRVREDLQKAQMEASKSDKELMDLKRAQQKTAKKMADKTKAWEDTVADLKEKLKNQATKMRVTVEAMEKTQRDAVPKEHVQLIAGLRQELAQIRQELVQVQQQHSDDKAQQQKQHTEAISKQQKQHDADKAQQQKQHSDDKAQQQKLHTEALSQQQKQFCDDKAHQQKQHDTDKAHQQKLHIETINKQQKQHSDDKTHQQKLHTEALKVNHGAQVNVLAQLEDTVTALTAQLTTVKAEWKAARDDRTTTFTRLSGMQRELAEKEADMVSLKNKIAAVQRESDALRTNNMNLSHYYQVIFSITNNMLPDGTPLDVAMPKLINLIAFEHQAIAQRNEISNLNKQVLELKENLEKYCPGAPIGLLAAN